MKAWGHVTAKRTYVLSNTHLIQSLDSGPMKRKDLHSEVSTTDRYESQDGRKRFKGNKNLKGTQLLSFQFSFFFLSFPDVKLQYRHFKVKGQNNDPCMSVSSQLTGCTRGPTSESSLKSPQRNQRRSTQCLRRRQQWALHSVCERIPL